MIFQYAALFIVVTALVGEADSGAPAPRVATLVAEGDSAYDARNSDAAFQRYSEAEKLQPDCRLVRSRLAKVYTAWALVSVKPIDENWNYPKAKQYADAALRDDSADADSHIALAVYYGWKTFLTSETRERVELSRKMHDEATRALELNPQSDFACNILGQWNREVSRLAWYEKAAVSVVYGGLPDASYRESLKLLWRAAGLAPKRMMHRLELAKTYVAMGDTDTGRKMLDEVIAMTHIDGVDEKVREEARKVRAGMDD
jgi:FimV-like protein